MRLAIFSDIHGNLEALQAVLKRCADIGVDRTICLGDLVGYGADPNACIDLVRGVADVVLAGNHDRVAAGLEDARLFNPMASAAIRWTAAALTEAHVGYLQMRSLTAEEGDVLYVHASPYRPETWPYIHFPEEGRAGLAYTEARVCFVGHSHRAFLCAERDDVEVLGEGDARLMPLERYLINVGSVGQPRDGDPRAAFAIWDQEAAEFRLCRVPYDVAGAQARIREAGLPELLAERLGVGR